jgi:adenylate cyclase
MCRGQCPSSTLSDWLPRSGRLRLAVLPIYRNLGPALVYHAMGRGAESAAALAEYTKEHADEDAFEIAEAHAFRGEVDQAFAWLDRAYRQKDPSLYMIKGDPDFKNIEPDPRYKALMRKMNLPE